MPRCSSAHGASAVGKAAESAALEPALPCRRVDLFGASPPVQLYIRTDTKNRSSNNWSQAIATKPPTQVLVLALVVVIFY